MEDVFLLLLLCCLAPSAANPAAAPGVDEEGPFRFTGMPHLHPAGGEHVVDAGSTWTIRWLAIQS